MDRRWMNGARERGWLAQARMERRLTQWQAADICGISRLAYQMMEYGLKAPTRLVRRRLNKRLGYKQAARKEGGNGYALVDTLLAKGKAEAVGNERGTMEEWR